MEYLGYLEEGGQAGCENLVCEVVSRVSPGRRLFEMTLQVSRKVLRSPQMIKGGGSESKMEEMLFELVLCEGGIYME